VSGDFVANPKDVISVGCASAFFKSGGATFGFVDLAFGFVPRDFPCVKGFFPPHITSATVAGGAFAFGISKLKSY
jgi:hypothetical protein